MDAKVGDWVVTPRIGKPVEINALWHNALCTLAQFAAALRQSAREYEAIVSKALASFQRFWNVEKGYCYDVIDGPDGNNADLRSNQLSAVSLPESPLHRTATQYCRLVWTTVTNLLWIAIAFARPS